MLYIRTGKPGHGKTLNTIREVDQKAHKEGRVVYYHNVSDLKPEKLQASWFEFEDPHLWYELPQDAIIVVDEAQGWFGVRDPRQKPPEYVSRFEVMRHHGHEVHLVTQDPRYIDVHLRRLCNGHIHYWRVFKSQRLLRFESEVVVEKVEVMSSFKDADKSRIKLDRRYFDVYRSTNAKHHFAFKPPKKVIFAVAIIVGAVFLGARAYLRISEGAAPSHAEQAKAGESASGAQSSVVESAQSAVRSIISPVDGVSKSQATLTPEQYVERRAPRLADIPSSAPIYDDLTKPVTHPRLYCMSSSDPELVARRPVNTVKNGVSCQCYSQQATKVNTSFDFCMQVAQDGYFDPTLPDRGQQLAIGPNGAMPQPPVAPVVASSPEYSQPQQPAEPRLTVIPHEKGEFLW